METNLDNNTHTFEDIWNSLRRNIKGDESKLRDFVLSLLFYRYLSDNIVYYINIEKNDIGRNYDYSFISDNEAEKVKDDIIEELGYFIYPSQLFENVKKFNINDLESTLESIFNNIRESSRESLKNEVFEDLFINLAFKSSQLGEDKLIRNANLGKILNEIDNVNYEISNPEWKNILKDLFNFFLKTYATKNRDDFYTSPEIAELLALIALSSNKEFETIYDPAFGTGTLLIKVSELIENVKDKKYYGQDINLDLYNIGKMNMLLHNISYKDINISVGDTINEPKYLEEQPFDIILSNLPFKVSNRGMHSPRILRDNLIFEENGILSPKVNPDFAFILHALSALSKEGVAVLLSFPGILYKGGADQRIREYLVENNFIDAIIQLPSKLFSYSRIAPIILVLKRDKKDNSILFINASEYYIKDKFRNNLSQEDIEKIVKLYQERKNIENISKIATPEEIKKEEYNLSIYIYTDTSEDIKFKNSCKLKDLVESIQIGNYRFSNKRNNKDKEVFVININDLNNTLTTTTSGLSIVETSNLKKVLEPNDIVVSRNLESFRGTLIEIEDSDKPVIAAANTFILKVNKEKIDPLFLLYVLTSSLGKGQLNKRIPDSGMIRTISAKTLENLDIPIISLEKQKELVQRYLDLFKEREELEKQLKQKNLEIETFPVEEI